MEKIVILFPCVWLSRLPTKNTTYAEARELQSQSVHAFAAGEAACWGFSGRPKVVSEENQAANKNLIEEYRLLVNAGELFKGW